MFCATRQILWALPALCLCLCLCLLGSSCERQQKPATHKQSQEEWSAHEKQLLSFIKRYKTEDPEQAQQAMAEELDYLNQPLEEELSPQDLSYLKAISLVRLGLVTHHLGKTTESAAHFAEGVREFNLWCAAVGKDEHQRDQVIAAVIGFDQDFCADWHEPWKSQLIEEPTIE